MGGAATLAASSLPNRKLMLIYVNHVYQQNNRMPKAPSPGKVKTRLTSPPVPA